MKYWIQLEAGTAVHQARIDEDCGRVQVAGSIASEERHNTADLFGLGHAAKRDGGVDDFHLLRVFEGRFVDRRGYGARTDSDDRDVVRPSSRPAWRVSIRMPPLDKQ